MTLIVTLFLIGLVCLCFEVITPGGILGAIGGIFMLIGCVLVWSTYGATAGLTAIVSVLILAGILVYIEIFVLPKTRIGRGIFNNAAITGASQPPPASEKDVVGRECVALTTLAPTGYVLLDGKRYEARSLSGYIEKDATLVVSSLDTFTLQVTKK
ncbi:membrane-bound ClpP family serine protease [Ereboglobus sp. PH5-5]|uniref:NfeD family protein n=1 Tax=unclassified Ereboglobus TaxID=2626932 RepID=UPI0024060D08|nr:MULTISPECIES: NfeD family protein [unclassified Ereboglobus]MDF9828562.1 membrane-bound ClpP family serine protease [Ereboglobus sp. PH5-10]MDF9832464.1 membrane-bound ClpP family serine protease [Ereboglobus sp. PH5-5]